MAYIFFFNFCKWSEGGSKLEPKNVAVNKIIKTSVTFNLLYIFTIYFRDIYLFVTYAISFVEKIT
jgi:hypothetical protein